MLKKGSCNVIFQCYIFIFLHTLWYTLMLLIIKLCSIEKQSSRKIYKKPKEFLRNRVYCRVENLHNSNIRKTSGP